MIKQYPKHVAIILDGNRRWAKQRNLPSLKGHQKGFERIEQLAPYILEKKGVEVLSVFAFSNENFNRSAEEVNYLMDLFVKWFKFESQKFNKKNIKIIFSGRKDNLREDVVASINAIEEKTKNNTKGIFNVCLNYGGQQEIVDVTKKMALDIKNNILNIENINEDILSKYMYNDLPPIDFMIRTSGEMRISNFMLYNLAYAELYFTNTLFPDFDFVQFELAIDEYNKRERRFGGDSNETKSN